MTNLIRIETDESNFHFSGEAINKLGASEYTLVNIVVDMSGSVSAYRSELTECIKTIVSSCKYSQRAENLMIRLTTFNNGIYEEHGFSLLNSLDVNSYQNTINPTGATALYDATANGIEAIKKYGAELYDQDFDVNGIVFIVTDGDDNNSSANENDIKNLIAKVTQEEKLESLRTILIGVNTQYGDLQRKLEGYKKNALLDQYVDIRDADKNNLAKLANFISKSISAQSLALGTGGPSVALIF